MNMGRVHISPKGYQPPPKSYYILGFIKHLWRHTFVPCYTHYWLPGLIAIFAVVFLIGRMFFLLARRVWRRCRGCKRNQTPVLPKCSSDLAEPSHSSMRTRGSRQCLADPDSECLSRTGSVESLASSEPEVPVAVQNHVPTQTTLDSTVLRSISSISSAFRNVVSSSGADLSSQAPLLSDFVKHT